jgi:putative flippase GtrA
VYRSPKLHDAIIYARTEMVSSSWSRAKLAYAWDNRAISIKAISFALIGLVNTVVDYSVFLSARAALEQTTEVPALFVARSVSRDTVILIAANVAAWLVAVTGSYIMNSSVTFAVESGRKLRWRDYAAFVGAGIAGLIANTVMLVFGAKCLLLPLWIAKAVAILVSFLANFSLSHFVVFSVRDNSRPKIYQPPGFVDDKFCST